MNVTSRVVLGGRFGEEETDLSFARLSTFAERGGRYVDTAHSYADGRAEGVIGSWLRANDDGLEVLTKVGHPDRDGVFDMSARQLRTEVNESCRRLGRDMIDLVVLHRDDPARQVAELAETLLGFVRRGQARQIGVSNWSALRLAELVPVLRSEGHSPVVSYQWSLAQPDRPLWPETRSTHEVAGVIEDFDLRLFAWAAQARGFFAGRVEPASADGPDPFDTPTNRARRTRCREVAERHGVPPATVAVAWLLNATDAYPIVGPRTLAELHHSLDAAALDLDDATCSWLEHGPSASALLSNGDHS